MNDFWEVLNVHGDLDEAEIIFSKIENYCLGSFIDEDLTRIYLSIESRSDVVNIINNLELPDNISLTWEKIDNEDWHLMWKENFTPVSINNKINILPDWHFKDNINNSNIYIRPGMSFGTGHHETTSLMVESLIDYSNNEFSLLDLGTGSGILSIVGSKLKYKDIKAVEFDIECKDDFYFNTDLNSCSKDIEIFWSDVLDWNDFSYDLILANIEKNIIKKMINNIENTNARFIFSGLLIEDKDEIEKLLIKNNFKIENFKSKNEWLLIDCKKI